MSSVRAWLAGLLAVGAVDVAAVQAGEKSVLFGELMGMYVVDSDRDDWQVIGPGTGSYPASYASSKAGLGDGEVGRVLLGYRAGAWDLAVAGQRGDLSHGSMSRSSGPSDAFADGHLSATYWGIDATVGYNTRMGAAATRWGLGVRYADWNNELDTTAPGEFVHHKWKGFGPRGEVQGSIPLSGAWSLQFGAGVSYMWGDLTLTAPPAWFCDDCTNYGADSWSLDGSIGLGWQVASSSTLVFGYRAEYWSDVNVKISDNSGNGKNEGTSGHLLQGPFVALKFALGN